MAANFDGVKQRMYTSVMQNLPSFAPDTGTDVAEFLGLPAAAEREEYNYDGRSKQKKNEKHLKCFIFYSCDYEPTESARCRHC